MSYAATYGSDWDWDDSRSRKRRRGVSAADTAPAAAPSLIEQVMANPLIVAIGVGVTTGVIAAVRGKQISQRALYITTVVTAIGETALILDEPEDKRPDLTKFAALSAVGVLIGLAPFTSWKLGDKSWIQKGAEAIADKLSPAPPPETDLVTV